MKMRRYRIQHLPKGNGVRMEVVGIRGAIVAAENDAGAVTEATVRLVHTLLTENDLDASAIISMFFTMTPDLNAAYPAAAAREVCGLDVPLLCATEIAVPGSLRRVIRVLVHAYSPLGRGGVVHAYIGEAEKLRPDLKRGGRDR
jgi:chorismate mutase